MDEVRQGEGRERGEGEEEEGQPGGRGGGDVFRGSSFKCFGKELRRSITSV